MTVLNESHIEEAALTWLASLGYTVPQIPTRFNTNAALVISDDGVDAHDHVFDGAVHVDMHDREHERNVASRLLPDRINHT